MPYYNGRWHRYSEAERREYGRQQREIYRQAWHEKWISKTGLKEERNWTDTMIKTFLEGKSESAGKIQAYKRTLITKVEKTKKFQVAMAERVARQKKKKV
ncbi:hypothetical protein J7H99_001517 [Vibrio parahaemolyticus]|nr:hypothetical protein [Vibrio parahaemolyticus]EHH1215899.1 hypothetical protein [Vibrio parahaemolyticus]EIA1341694.1 hypothetical protein [Vibrio parahaemolyticus]EKK9992628.1 hypothetical protein [Vibrio parahaemolyticus]EMA9068179.1 hypothetical protein [Vibrio parahaemolyticus]